MIGLYVLFLNSFLGCSFSIDSGLLPVWFGVDIVKLRLLDYFSKLPLMNVKSSSEQCGNNVVREV